MRPANHGDRHDARESRQRGGHGEATAGNRPRICEPELEEVADDEQCGAEIRRGIEEIEEGRFDVGGSAPDMCVRNDEEAGIGHGGR